MLRLAAVICAAILTLAALWAARAVMTSVAFALPIMALVWPLQRRLKARLPSCSASARACIETGLHVPLSSSYLPHTEGSYKEFSVQFSR